LRITNGSYLIEKKQIRSFCRKIQSESEDYLEDTYKVISILDKDLAEYVQMIISNHKDEESKQQYPAKVPDVNLGP
jgi:hypothetical protein